MAASRVRMASLSRAAATAAGGLWRRPSSAGGLGRGLGAHVVHGDHGVYGYEVVVRDDHPGRLTRIVQGHLEDARARDRAQGVGLLGADDDVDTQGPGGIEEVLGPVCGRRDEEE